MQLSNSAESYGAIPKFLHWLTVTFVAVAWILGTFGDEIPRGAARSAALSIHISAGLAILVLLAVRLIWRLIDHPPLPEKTPFGVGLEFLGKLTHYALYLLLAAVPVFGIVLQFAGGNALPVFGLMEVASPWTRERIFEHSVKEIHEVLANALVILACLHALAAMVHHWVWHDRTLERMLPRIARRTITRPA